MGSPPLPGAQSWAGFHPEGKGSGLRPCSSSTSQPCRGLSGATWAGALSPSTFCHLPHSVGLATCPDGTSSPGDTARSLLQPGHLLQSGASGGRNKPQHGSLGGRMDRGSSKHFGLTPWTRNSARFSWSSYICAFLLRGGLTKERRVYLYLLVRLHQSPHSAHAPLRGGFDQGKAVCGQGAPCRASDQHGGVHMHPEHPVATWRGGKMPGHGSETLCVHCSCAQPSPGAQEFPPGHGQCREMTLGLVDSNTGGAGSTLRHGDISA